MEGEMPRPPQETTAWVASIIAQKTDVSGTEVTSPSTFRVNRKALPPFEALVLSLSEVTDSIFTPLLAAYPHVAFVVNVPKDGLWAQSGIAAARSRGLAFGHKLEDVSEYKKSENAFVERGLSQHDHVSHFEQESDRVYMVFRFGLDPLRIVLLNEYELTAEHVRNARSRYGSFDIVLMTNPNGSATTEAKEAAKGMRVPILPWRQFLGRLSSE
jgi:hypothetical protein